MNCSGEAVREAMQFYKSRPNACWVLFDDVSLDPGRLRIRRQGSDGGHNGIKNMIYLTGKDTFPRIKNRRGEKKPHPGYDLAAWVLGKFPKELADTMDKAYERAAEAAQLIIEGKIDEAMNRYNA